MSIMRTISILSADDVEELSTIARTLGDAFVEGGYIASTITERGIAMESAAHWYRVSELRGPMEWESVLRLWTNCRDAGEEYNRKTMEFWKRKLASVEAAKAAELAGEK